MDTASAPPTLASTVRALRVTPDRLARENLAFQGQTSWEVCRQNHFELPLATGAKTLRTAKVGTLRTSQGRKARGDMRKCPR